MSSEDLLVVETDGVVEVILNRPGSLNALYNPLKDKVAETFEGLATSTSAKAVILKGNGKAFCAGADIKENAAMDRDGARVRLEKWDRMYRAIRNLPQPLVCQIHGYAAGAGFQIAMLADLRIAADNAKLGMTEVNIGSVCILGSAILAPLVGRAITREVVMRGEFIDARRAETWHLVNEVVPADELDERVRTIARDLAAKPSGPMASTKRWLREIDDELFEAAITKAHAAHAANFETGAFTAGAKQFVGSRASSRTATEGA